MRFTDSQIIVILKQAEAETTVPKLYREHGISSASFYKWCSTFGGMDAALMSRLKELEEEKSRLKKKYARERLESEIIQEAMVKKVVRPSERKQMAQHAVIVQRVSVRQACQIFTISECCSRQPLRKLVYGFHERSTI